MKDELSRYLDILATGKPAEFKNAKRGIERLWHENSEKFQKEATLVFPYLKLFDKITDPKNQAALASGMSLFFLALADDYFDILKNFSLSIIQSSHGHVREAIRKTADWLYVSITARTDPFSSRSQKLTGRQINNQVIAKAQYHEFLRQITDLMDQYSYLNDDQTEYIDEMKPSVLKSLELLYDRLTFSHDAADFLHQSTPVVQLKRKEIEGRLIKLFRKTKPQISLHTIKQIIYLEDGSDDFHKLISLSSNCPSDCIEEVVSTLNDAWNYFPHRCLDGKAPVEVVRESKDFSSGK